MPEAAVALSDDEILKRHFPKLTTMERNILAQLAHGKKAKEIARERGMNPKTIESHTCHIREKLEVDSITKAILMAIRAGISYYEHPGRPTPQP